MSKVPRVIFRIQKLKSWAEISTAAGHNLRERPTPNAGPEGFVQLVQLDQPAHDAVREVIGEQTIRKNAVLAVEAIVSASPEYFRPNAPGKAGFWEKDKLEAWRASVEPWIKEKFPHAVSVVLHLDEATPHYQIIDVPLDEKGKLNCRGKFGGRENLEAWQTSAAEPVAHLGIQRGIEGSAAKHERVRAFYAAVNEPGPQIPSVSTPKPTPLPSRTIAEKLPLTQAHSDRGAQEAQAQQQEAEWRSQVMAQNRAKLEAWPVVSMRAAATDLEQRKRKQAEETAAKLQEQRKVADQLRALSLETVLHRVYGASLKKGSRHHHASRKFELPDGREIAVTRGTLNNDVWIEQGGEGSRGAINLVMHLDGLPYRDAVRLLAEHFDSTALTQEHARTLVQRASRDVDKLTKGPVAAPPADASKWPRVRTWLHEVRGMPCKLVDKLHSLGLIYADSRANATFKRAAGGAFQRGTGTTKFHRSIGGPECGPFIVPGTSNEVVIVEAPLDAIAMKAIRPGATAIASGGDQLPPEKLRQWVPEGSKVFAGQDADTRGEKVAKLTKEAFQAERLEPARKDWAETVQNEPWRVQEPWSHQGSAQPAGSSPRPVKRPS